MTHGAYRFIVFTKPWQIGLEELGEKVAGWGFDGIELPVRPGFSVTPDNIADELPRAERLLRERWGLRIESIAGPTTPDAIRACGEAGIGVIRVCSALAKTEAYGNGEARLQREWGGLLPHLQDAKVAIGVQNHSGRFVPVHAMGLARLLAPFDPRYVCAVWDAAHNALEGEEPEIALDHICGPALRMVNLKNGFKRQVTGSASGPVTWRTYWTSGRQGVASWPRVAADLRRRGWGGPICLTAEYSDPASVDRLIAEDLPYARTLFSDDVTV